MVLLVALSGCRNRYATVSEDLLPLAKELSPDRLFSEVLVRHDKNTSAQMKAMAYVSLGGNTARSRVQIRWARDRALQISILPLMGVEICPYGIDSRYGLSYRPVSQAICEGVCR